MSIERGHAENNPVLGDLIGPRELQEMQDSFAEVANVAVRTVDPQGNFLTKMSHAPALCADHLQNDPSHNKLCRACLPMFLGGEGIVDEDLSFECIPGLKHYLVPLKVNRGAGASLILGYMVIGPIVFMQRRDKQSYADIAAQFSITLEEMWSQLLELRVFSYKGIHSFLEMVGHLTGRILDLSYAEWVLREGARSPAGRDTLQRAARLGGDTEDEFLKLFLDLVMDITNGNRGSLMLWDSRKKILSIRAAQGIPEDVVLNTEVRAGAGVSGLAFEQRRAFLIDGDRVDPAVADRLSQPETFSSIVMPISTGEAVLGVLNIASDRSMPVQFDDSTLVLVRRAAALAGVALRSLCK
ncbi:MAG: PocR ligand-binding domain-containing protein [Deltaproteobacteria bacterium]